MKSPDQIHSPSCPNCEFTKGNCGKPSPCGDGTMICATCNTRWRDIAHLPKSEFTPQKTGKRKITISLPSAISANNTRPLSLRSAGLYAVLAVFLGSSIVFSYNFYQRNFNIKSDNTAPGELILGQISVKNIQNINTPVWVISGTVSNNSTNILNVPSILMSSGTKGSSGYFTWTYHPALQILSPGSNFRFRTSVRKPLGNSGGIELKFIRGNLESG